MPTKKKTPWRYGQSPAPRNWQEASEVLRSLQTKKKGSTGFLERLEAILAKVQEKK